MHMQVQCSVRAWWVCNGLRAAHTSQHSLMLPHALCLRAPRSDLPTERPATSKVVEALPLRASLCKSRVMLNDTRLRLFELTECAISRTP